MKNNIKLVEYAYKALNESWGYCLGEFGRVLTNERYNYNIGRQGAIGEYNRGHKDYLKKLIGNRVTDCYGLVKGFVWTDAQGNVKYDGKQDRNQEGAYTAAKEKGALATMPEIPGLVLWMKGHAGVYVGNGEFIECAGAPVGMQKGTIKNGVVTKGSRFTHWFKDSYIDYNDEISLVDKLFAKGFITDKEHWQSVLDGKQASNKDFLKILLERAVLFEH